LVPNSSLTFLVAYLPSLVCIAGIESNKNKIINSSNIIANSFSTILSAFLINRLINYYSHKIHIFLNISIHFSR